MATRWRLEPEQVSGRGWRVVAVKGNKRKGTRLVRPVSADGFTLEQAQAFCNNNRDIAKRMNDEQ